MGPAVIGVDRIKRLGGTLVLPLVSVIDRR